MTNYTIYVDLDGVLCDFLKLTSVLTGKTLKSPKDWHLVKNTAWPIIASHGASFWEALPWTNDGKELWDFVEKFNPSILSAYPLAVANREFAVTGKQNWVRRELNNYDTIHIVSAIEKQNYAHQNAILIDDHDRNVNQFVKKGGIGIHHTSTHSTINQLESLL